MPGLEVEVDPIQDKPVREAIGNDEVSGYEKQEKPENPQRYGETEQAHEDRGKHQADQEDEDDDV
jgi:hypothetical protein